MNGVNFHDEMVNNISIRDLSLSRREAVIPREIIVSKEVFEALANNGCCPEHDAEIVDNVYKQGRQECIDDVLKLCDIIGFENNYEEQLCRDLLEELRRHTIDEVLGKMKEKRNE